MSGPLGARSWHWMGWHWMGWWGYAKRKEFYYIHIYIYLIQLEYKGKIPLDRPGGMREAINNMKIP